MAVKTWKAWTDGACNNTLPVALRGAGASAIIATQHGQVNLVRASKSASTSNAAELAGIYLAIQYFVENDDGQREYIIYSDSKWSVCTLRQDIGLEGNKYNSTKQARIRERIVALATPIKSRLRLIHIKRSTHNNNILADKLAKEQRQIAEKLLRNK